MRTTSDFPDNVTRVIHGPSGSTVGVVVEKRRKRGEFVLNRAPLFWRTVTAAATAATAGNSAPMSPATVPKI